MIKRAPMKIIVVVKDFGICKAESGQFYMNIDFEDHYLSVNYTNTFGDES